MKQALRTLFDPKRKKETALGTAQGSASCLATPAQNTDGVSHLEDFYSIAQELSRLLQLTVEPSQLEKFLAPIGTPERSYVIASGPDRFLMGWTNWNDSCGEQVYCATFGMKLAPAYPLLPDSAHSPPEMGDPAKPTPYTPFFAQIESPAHRSAVLDSLNALIYLAYHPNAGGRTLGTNVRFIIHSYPSDF